MKDSNKVFIKENLKPIRNFVKRTSAVIIPILGVALSSISVKDLLDMIRYNGDAEYNDAVKAIMDSNMLGSDKARMMDVLKREEDSEFYKAVISTVKSNILGSTKVEIIKNMCKSTDE